MSASWAVRRFARISNTVTAELTAGPGGFTVEWIGGRPRNLTPAQCRRYRAARDALLGEVAARSGLRIAVVEV